MTTRSQSERSKGRVDAAVLSREGYQTLMNRADALRFVLITVGIQLLFRLMLLLRRWNY